MPCAASKWYNSIGWNMDKALIYIVEDDEGIQEVYEGAFEGVYDVRIFGDGASFFRAFEEKRPSLAIIDIMLPDIDGYTILTRLREKDERLPVIIVSAKSDEISFVKGLNKGADDYVSKPFSIMELLARVKAGLRRANLYVLRHNDFSVNEKLYDISYRGQKLGLTVKEFKLLKLLIERAGETLTRDEIFKTVWGEDFMGETRALDMHIAQIRDKIKAAGGDNVIVTVRGVGYRVD